MDRGQSMSAANQDRPAEPLAATDVQALQEQLLRGLLRALSIIGLFVSVLATYDAYASQDLWAIPSYWISYGTVVLLAFWRKAPYALQAWAIIALLYILGFVDFFQGGPSGSARVLLLAVPFLAGVFMGRRQSIFALLLITLTMGGFGLAYTTGLITSVDNPAASDASNWAAGTFTLFMLGVMITYSLNYLVPRLGTALSQSRDLTRQLEAERAGLAVQVEERTAALERRSIQLEAAAQVAQEAASIQDVDLLLTETAHLISHRFGFYHTGIFLLDERGEYAILRAASSEGGKRMLARGHRLAVGQIGIVGYVTGAGQARIALDVGEDAAFFDNPDLPGTRSEMALPLRARGRIIGALDVQSVEAQAFTEEDATVLQTLADQVGLAINNAQLFRQAQESLEAERRAYGQLSQEAWRSLLATQAISHQRYDPHGILPGGDGWQEEMVRAAREGHMVRGRNTATPSLAVPLKVRGEIVGVLDAHKPEGTPAWTAEEITLLESLVEQLGVALDSARLYQDTQQRAARDRMLGEVTARMRQTLDMETVLQTAIREIGDALGIAEVEVRMSESPTLTPIATPGQGNGNGFQGEE
jgi:GAF domain-containing protein